MERRRFLQSAGAAVAAGATALSHAGESPAEPPNDRPTVLITSAETPLGEAIAAALASSCRVRRLEMAATTGVTAAEAKKLLEESLRGGDAIVCLANPPDNADADITIDYRTRGVYELMGAAVRQGVRLVVYLSSLDLVAGYAERLQVDETFRPVPSTDAESLSQYLGEFVCREFAREGKIRCVSLRFGHIPPVRADAAAGGDPLALEMGDAVQAVERTLAAGLAQPARLAAWELFHIQSAFRGARFTTAKAQRVLGYKPAT